jgi:amino acid adenylation domain-containing protein
LLRRYAAHDEILIGIASALRKQPHSEDLIGFFANTLPIRADFTDDPGFGALVRRVRGKVRRAQEREDTPFEQILGVARPRRQPGLVPLVHALFSMIKVEHRGFEGPEGVRFQRIRMDRGNAKVPLAIVIASMERHLRCAIEYDTTLFDEAAIDRMWGHYCRILEEGLRSPDVPVSALPMLAPAEEAQLLIAWNDTGEHFPEDRPVHQYAESHAVSRPEAPAVVCGARSWSYFELNQMAGRLAQALSARGIGPGGLAAVCLPRSVEMVAAQWAVLKTGGTYLALEPAQPPARLAGMLKDAACRVVLVRPEEIKKYAALGFEALGVQADALMAEETPAENAPGTIGLTDAAYVVFTSGSTGRPKGVLVDHGGLLNVCAWFTRRFSLTAQDRLSCLFSPSFDALASEIWPCLMAGASLHFPDEEVRLSSERLRDWLVQARITVCSAPTVVAESLLGLAWPAHTALRYLVTGGDRLRYHPPASLPFLLVNLYGPTENTIISTCYEVPAQDEFEGPPAIGRPIANTQAYILDEYRKPVPVGVAGEIYLGGAQVARGYLHHPDLTAERFLDNPFGEGRLYRTGDLGRYRADGAIEFLGRRDTQVQLRGYRIELGEIERTLQTVYGVAEAVVTVSPDTRGEARLTAYLTRTAKLSAAHLRRALREELPEYMIPARFVVLPELPLTANVKIDRRRLAENPPPGETLHSEPAEQVAPRTAIERQLAAIWSELLDIPVAGVYDDFFALGGHSLLATQAVSRIQKVLGVEIPLSEFLAAPHVAALADKIAALARRTASPPGAGLVTSRPRQDPDRSRYLAHLDGLSEEQLVKTLQELE